MEIFLKFILLIISFMNILKSKKKKIFIGNYMIIDDRESIIDQRSLKFIKVKNLSLTVNLLRTNSINFKKFKLILSIPNFFCIKIYENFLKKIDTKYNVNKTYIKLFKYLNLKKLILIDDQRELAKFSRASRILKIKTMIYMHGKISKNTKSLKKTFFSYYLVWSKFFANQLLKSNPNFRKSKILVVGNPNLGKFSSKQKKNTFKIKKCLILDEDYIAFDEIKNYLNIIKINKENIKFFFKKKRTRDLPNSFKNFCKHNKIYIITKDRQIGNLVSKYKIDSIIASTSSGLLEGLFYELIPIKIKSLDKIRENEFKPFVSNKLIYNAYDKTNFEKILNSNFKKKDIKKKKIKVWGNSEFNSFKVKNTVENFIKY